MQQIKIHANEITALGIMSRTLFTILDCSTNQKVIVDSIWMDRSSFQLMDKLQWHPNVDLLITIDECRIYNILFTLWRNTRI